MKRFIHIANLVLFSLLIACQDNIGDTKDENNEVVTLTGKIDSNSLIGSRVGEDKQMNIETLNILVFDENGNFEEISEAFPGPKGKRQEEFTLTNGKFTFHFSIRSSTKPRILHFVANHSFLGVNQNEINMVMNTPVLAKEKEIYWQRRKMESISQSTTIEDLKLIRNVAQINVEADNISDFVYEGFAICHEAKSGTIAPLNYNAGYTKVEEDRFAKYVKEDGAISSYYELNAMNYYGCQPLGVEIDKDVPTVFTKEPKYVFENPWTEENGTFILVKGKFRGYTAYYKIELIDRNKKHYDILRNFSYNIKITKIRNRDFTNPEQSFYNQASNLVEHTDDINNNPQLFISCDHRYFYTPNEQHNASISYKYVYNNIVDLLIEDKDKKEFFPLEKSKQEGDKSIYKSTADGIIDFVSTELNKRHGSTRCTIHFKEGYSEGSQTLRICPMGKDVDEHYDVEFVMIEPRDVYVSQMAKRTDELTNIRLSLNLSGDKGDGNTRWYTELQDVPFLFPIKIKLSTADNSIVTNELRGSYDKESGKIIYSKYLTYDEYKRNKGLLHINFATKNEKALSEFEISFSKYFKSKIRTPKITIEELLRSL